MFINLGYRVLKMVHYKNLDQIFKNPMKKALPFLFLLSFGVLFSPITSAQDLDIHFSQFYFAPMQHNPALTGIFAEDVRVAGIYRNQWRSVPVDYQTFSAAFDMKLPASFIRPGQLAVGAVFNYDEAGDAQMTFAELGLFASLSYPLDPSNWLTIGFQAGGGQRAFSDGNLKWDEQFDGEVYNPSLRPSETFRNDQAFFSDFSTGLNWHFQKDKRFHFNLGSGIKHLTTPIISFKDNSELQWNMRFNGYFNISVPLNTKLDANLYTLGQFQGKASELLAVAGLKYHINPVYNFAVGANMGLRAGDALIPSIMVDYLQWTAGFSYDINTSEFVEATNGKGGPEIVIIYKVTKVKSTGDFRSCPVF